MNRPTFIAGLGAFGIGFFYVALQLRFYLTCGSGPPLCGVILPAFQFDFLALAGLALLVLSLRFGQSMAFIRAHHASVGLGLLLAGILAIVEGPALLGESGSLFGSYACFGSFVGCIREQDVMSFEYWSGVVLTMVGLGSVPTGLLLLVRSRTAEAQGVFAGSSQKRVAMVCLVLVSFISLFFLAPFVPVQVTSPSQQISGAHIVCHQIESAVHNPVFVYRGYASPGAHLLGVGNAVYNRCIVTNPAS